jgi:hypothetical protein
MSLQRGVFAKKKILKNTIITPDMIYFAMPIKSGQLSSGQFKENINMADIFEEIGAEVDRSIAYEAARPVFK